MNKKLFLGMFAAATMLFATSCQNDELDAVQAGNEATVSFNLGVEGGVQTRAISDGSGANWLEYAVFDKDGKRITTIAKVEKEVDDFPTTETITLAKGQTYKVAFWAQNSSTKAYDLDDNMNLTIDYDDLNNEEDRDAFFKTVEFTVTGNQPIDVVLKRPFAQINVGVTEKDWNAAVASGIDIQSSKVVIKNAAKKMNLIDGSVTTPVEVTYDFGATPKSTNEVLKVDLDGDGTPTGYNYLSMSYILVYDENGGAEKVNLDEVEFTFQPTDPAKNAIVFNTGLNGVPVQRNWRTNIIGQILTGTIDFNISIDHIYDGENDIVDGYLNVYGVRGGDNLYKTLDEALAAGESDILLAAGNYSLNTHSASIVAENVTITGADKDDVKVSITGQIRAKDGVTSLTLKNLTTEVPTGLAYDEFNFGFMHYLKNFTMENCKSNGRIRLNVHNALIDNCEFNVDVKSGFDGYAIYQYGADGSTVKVSNSTFNTVGKAIVLYSESPKVLNLDVENCTFVSSDATTDKAAIQMHTEYGITGTVDIKNSTATGFLNVNNGLWNDINNQTGVETNKFVVSVTLADGVVQKRNVYEISNANGMMWFANEVNTNGKTFSGETLKMTADIDLADAVWNPIGQTGATEFKGIFDGDNHTIKNLSINNTDESKNCSTGLFGWIESHGNEGVTVQNVTIDGATIKGHHNVAAIVGYVYGTVSNCHVKNAVISCVSVNDDANGDKCGTIAGYVGEDATIFECTATDSKIDAGRDAGQVVGAAKSACVTDCSATGVTVVANGTSTGKNITEAVIGRTL